MSPNELEDVDGGDVLVVGAGVAGLFTSVRLIEGGLATTLVDAVGVAAEQSGHHHGVLHEGSLYVGSSEGLVKALAAGRHLWEEWIGDLEPQGRRNYITISDPFKVAEATRWWEARGIGAERVDAAPGWLRNRTTVFRTHERAYDFTTVFERALLRLRDRTAALAVDGLEVENDRIRAVRGRRPDGTGVRIHADVFVLAAGCGLMPLLRQAGRSRGRLTIRTSYMLVLKAAGLPGESLMTVEPQLAGLFTAPRASAPGEAIWLIGDHWSSAGQLDDRGIESRWLHCTLEVLRALTTVLDGPGVQIGVYAASKAELRDDPNDLSPFGIETYGFSNAIVVTPTKLTLGPALADRAYKVVTSLANRRRQRFPPVTAPRLHVCPERWRRVPLIPLEQVEG